MAGAGIQDRWPGGQKYNLWAGPGPQPGCASFAPSQLGAPVLGPGGAGQHPAGTPALGLAPVALVAGALGPPQLLHLLGDLPVPAAPAPPLRAQAVLPAPVARVLVLLVLLIPVLGQLLRVQLRFHQVPAPQQHQ